MTQLTIQDAFDLAVRHHKSGELREAERLYRQVIARHPDHAVALHFLGLIAGGDGRHELAVELIGRAIALEPRSAETHFNFGIALSSAGRLDDAIAAFGRVIELNPGLPEAHGNLANVLRKKGLLDDAIAAFGQAIALRPDYADAHNNLGEALRTKGQVDEAVAAFRKAIEFNPNLAEAHSNLGISLRGKGQLDEAISAYRKAIALRPDDPEDQNNLGNALKEKGLHEEAIAAYHKAVKLRPKFAEALGNLGVALQDKGNLDEAITAYRRAVVLKPDYVDAHNNLGYALKSRGQLEESIAASRQAIAQNPDFHKAHSNLILTMYYDPDCSAQAIAEELRRWNQRHAEPLRKYIRPHGNDRDPQRRLRIGYVSPDFWDHPVGKCLLPLIAAHDRKEFEITCYASAPHRDEATARFKKSADRWRDIAGLTDEQAANQIREDQIDILVDLALHTGGNRLLVFARKPAPIQATYLGYPGSTGLATIDYRLTDPFIDPPGADDDYTETTLRLPRSYLCWQWGGKEVSVAPLPARVNKFVTFGCLNNFCKVTPAVLKTWGELMARAPNSRLILRCPIGLASQLVLATLADQGIDESRVELIARLPWDKYVALYHRIDLCLDPFPYCGHTVSLDSLWMGVPVVTLSGETAVGRGGRSILSNLGLPELIASTPADYVKIATELAGNFHQLGELRRTMRGRMRDSPLMDAPGVARDIESAYRRIWRIWCKTAPEWERLVQ